MTELQRQIQAQRFRRQIDDLVSVGELDDATSGQLYTLVGNLETNVTDSPLVYGRRARDVGQQLTAAVVAGARDPARPAATHRQSTPSPSRPTCCAPSRRRRTRRRSSSTGRTDRTLGAGGLAAFRTGD